MKIKLLFTAFFTTFSLLLSAQMIKNLPANYVLTYAREFIDEETIYFGDPNYFNELPADNMNFYRTANWMRKENTAVKDGRLVITLKKDAAASANSRGDKRIYSSGEWTDDMNFKYGYVEIRAKMPKIRNCWASICLYNFGNPRDRLFRYNEIDIMECDDRTEGYTFSEHWGDQTKGGEKARRRTKTATNKRTPTLGDDFHTYGLLWTKERLTFYFDSVEVKSFVNHNSFDPMLLSYNLCALKNVSDKEFPQTFEIDYVHLFQESTNKESFYSYGVAKMNEKEDFSNKNVVKVALFPLAKYSVTAITSGIEVKQMQKEGKNVAYCENDYDQDTGSHGRAMMKFFVKPKLTGLPNHWEYVSVVTEFVNGHREITLFPIWIESSF
ncbi:MAG: Beta-glucanase precursor [Bacteroidota bacterium]